MNARRIAAALVMTAAMAALVSATWAAEGAAQASAQAKKQMKEKSAAAKTIKGPVTKKTDNKQFQALDEATQMESKKFDTLSKSSKSRHGETQNAVRNER
jgi:outer membrane lipoprotein-sorting protein